MERRLYVGNLSDDVSVEALRQRFAEFGHVSDVHLATDRHSGRLRGHAFVTMGTAAEAHTAMTELNGTLFDERRLRVNMAGERGPSQGKTVDSARITSQFRERLNIVYELDCEGVALAIKMFPEDAREQAWRVEASVRRAAGADGIVVTASAPTRSAALEEISLSWKENERVAGIFALDWAAIKQALTAVRAV